MSKTRQMELEPGKEAKKKWNKIRKHVMYVVSRIYKISHLG